MTSPVRRKTRPRYTHHSRVPPGVHTTRIGCTCCVLNCSGLRDPSNVPIFVCTVRRARTRRFPVTSEYRTLGSRVNTLVLHSNLLGRHNISTTLKRASINSHGI